ncbi:MAG: hypothetical protein HRT66_13910 [Flavobacteriaceae bacterium]|nr:hypothetical protein [Flavobacteriaceae bacterium]
MSSSKIKMTLLVICLIASINTFGQDTIYLNANKKSTFIKKDVCFFKIYSNYSDKEKRHFTKLYNTEGIILYDKTYKTKHRKNLIESTSWYETGEKHVYYKRKYRKYYFITYWKNGNIRKKTIYTKDDELKEGSCWNSKGNIIKYRHDYKELRLLAKNYY